MRTTYRQLHRHRCAAALAALSLAGALALTGCGADAGGARSSSADRAAAKPAEGAEGAAQGGPGVAPGAPSAGTKDQQQPAAVRPQVIRTATLAIEAQDPQKALAGARTAAEGAGGYVGNESTRRGEDGRMTSTMSLRVPSERFDSVLGAMEGSGRLRSRKVEAQDVTQKVADVDSRVKSQQASVARVREMMEKASALSDVVMLEGELSRRQSDLEALLAQQTALKDQTALGTITLEVSEPEPRPAAKDPEKRPGFTQALGAGWGVFTAIVRFLTLAVGALLPFALAAAVGLAAFRVYRRLRPGKPRTGPVPKRVPAPRAEPEPEPEPVPAPDDEA